MVFLKRAVIWGDEESKMQCFSVRESEEDGSKASNYLIRASGESCFIIDSIIQNHMNLNKGTKLAMLNSTPTNPSRILQLIHSPSVLQSIKHSHILVVGAGGIGCEVIKNLSRSGVTHLSLIDYDRIQQTNLNRQFYFRQSHIGLPKTEILKEVMVQFGMHITSYNVDLFQQQLPHSFWNSLTLIISALDSMKARQQLSRLAMKFNKPLVDAGTLGFNGQVMSTVRFSSSCHNCQQCQPEEVYAACTIRNSPTINSHIGVYAKNFFEAYFSDQSLFLSQLNYKQSSSPKHVFSVLFSGLTSPARSLLYDDVQLHPQLYNIATTTSIYEEDSIHDIPYYCRNFLSTLQTLTQERRKQQFSLEKDNHTMILLLTCLFNLRVYNYKPTSQQLKYLTYYQCKDLITKVYFAIASASSIAAGVQVTESIKLITKTKVPLEAKTNTINETQSKHDTHEDNLYISFVNFSDNRLQPSYLTEPNLECLFCSKRVIYAQVKANLEERTFQQLDQFLTDRFYTYNRKMYHQNAIVWDGKQKGRKLNHFKHIIKRGEMEVECRPIQGMTDLKVSVLVIHWEEDGFTVKDSPSKEQIRQQLIQYLEEKEKDNVLRLAEDVGRYGVC